jgi:hypothetical protein
MALHRFSPTVYVKTHQIGITSSVSHVEGAAWELMKWRRKRRKWKLAAKSCINCFEGRVTPQDVQKAFEAAAKEQKMLLPGA